MVNGTLTCFVGSITVDKIVLHKQSVTRGYLRYRLWLLKNSFGVFGGCGTHRETFPAACWFSVARLG